MASWNEVRSATPELADAVSAAFDAHRHKTMATLRRDGSPRISGVEAYFSKGELWLGMMKESRKALDLLRDPRVALHSSTADPSMSGGDAKISGRAVEITDRDATATPDGSAEGQDSHLFRVDVTEVVLTTIGDPADHLVIESWHEGKGSKRVERK